MHTPTRRAVLRAGAVTTAVNLLGACSGATGSGGHPGHDNEPAPRPGGYVSPSGTEVGAAEAQRTGGPERAVKLTAVESRLDLGSRSVTSWVYGDRLPGQEVRVTAGDTLALTLANHLPQSTSLHWHGLALRNDMDGVAGLTQRAIGPGASFTYRFAVPHAGTYWFHPHSGTQQDRGLYAPLIVEDPREPLTYDHEWVVVLDDWVDGVDGSTPDGVLAELSRGMDGTAHDHGGSEGSAHDMGMRRPLGERETPSPTASGPSRVMMGARSVLLGGDAGDVAHPYYLLNGRTAEAPQTFRAKPGDRVRIRFINAGADTAFRVALGGHTMTVTHTDGFPVEHATTDALLLGMGERYDVLVTAKDGVSPLVALAEGKDATAMALLRTGGGLPPSPSVRPRELTGALLTADRLTADPRIRLAPRRPDRTVSLKLTGGMEKYDWAFNGKPYEASQRHPLRMGERVRLVFTNTTKMWHPVHLHGHTFAFPNHGPRKDTAIVLPGRALAVDFDADNPGLWMVHCHNVYHAETGMMTVLGYRQD